MNKHYKKAVSPSATQPTKSVQSNVNEHELVNSAEHKAEYSEPTAKGISTIYYANEQQVDSFIQTHQLYCFFTRKQW